MREKIQLFVLLSVSVVTGALSATAAEPNLKEIMQGLRNDTVEIADGLFLDDFTRVEEAALRIANHDRIPPEQVQLVAAELGAEMPAFKQFDMSVHDLALSIAAAAKAADRDRAIEDYQSMLNGCLGCHAAYRVRVAAVLGGATAANNPGR